MSLKRTIGKGIYVIVDPSQEESILLHKVQQALAAGICAVQIWDNFSEKQDIKTLIDSICTIAHEHHIPVLINNRWEWLQSSDLDGVHFDEIPSDMEQIRSELRKPFIVGVTCGNDVEKVIWASNNGADYISFCSIFPSGTQNSCELVRFETIRKTLDTFQLPVFLAGGITPDNISQLSDFAYTGIAVVSGIMNAHQPEAEIKKYITRSNLSV